MTDQRKIRHDVPLADNPPAIVRDTEPARGVESPRLRGWQPRSPLAGHPEAVAPQAVAGDAILSAEVSTGDLSAGSAARLGGRAIALAGVVVVAGVVLSRLIGWARTAVFFAEFGGSSNNLDSFYAAFRIPDTLFQLVAAGAVGSALVPVVSELLAKGEPDRARRVISTIANLMIVVLIPLAIVVWIMAPAIVTVLLPTTDPAQLDLRIGLTRVMLLSPILLGVGAVMTAGLNAVGIFGAPAMAPNVYNIGIIVCAVVLTPFLGVQALAIGVVVGAAGHVLTQVPAVRQAGLYAAKLHIHDPAVKETLVLMAPRALGLGVTQIVFLVNTYFASTMKDGSGAISQYFGAFTALQIPVGLIGVPLGIVLLPPLSQAVARGDDERFRRLVDQSVRLLLFAVIPLTGFMLVLGSPTIGFLYQHGAFDAAATASMTPVYDVFLLGLVAHVLIALLAPIFYSGKDTRTPVTAALVAVAVDVVSAIALFPIMGLEGLALAIGLGAWAEVAVLVTLMERRIGFDLRPLVRHAVEFAAGGVVASAAAYVVARLVDHGGSPSLVVMVMELSLGGMAGLAAYAGWARMFRLPELDGAIDLVRTLIGRRAAGR
jgi:putative peptidoglycan lipid II flippase